jgi:amino acid transporter
MTIADCRNIKLENNSDGCKNKKQEVDMFLIILIVSIILCIITIISYFLFYNNQTLFPPVDNISMIDYLKEDWKKFFGLMCMIIFVTVGAPLIFYSQYYKDKIYKKSNIKYKCPNDYVCTDGEEDCYKKECKKCCMLSQSYKTSKNLRISFFLIFCYLLPFFFMWYLYNENTQKTENKHPTGLGIVFLSFTTLMIVFMCPTMESDKEAKDVINVSTENDDIPEEVNKFLDNYLI